MSCLPTRQNGVKNLDMDMDMDLLLWIFSVISEA